MRRHGARASQDTTRSDTPRSVFDCDGVLFDLDGVLTPTAQLHEAAWKQTFDEFLTGYGRARERPFEHAEYLEQVDGKPRADGVRGFLEGRGIALPEGEADDRAGTFTVAGLARRKDDLFKERLEQGGVAAFPGALELLQALRGREIPLAVVSSSRNCSAVLKSAGISDFFAAEVDGNVARSEGLHGKPAPDTFLQAARMLELEPSRCAVLEDALAGVEAGRAGGFGLVIGVDRSSTDEALHEHGADLVVHHLAELLPEASSEQ